MILTVISQVQPDNASFLFQLGRERSGDRGKVAFGTQQTVQENNRYRDSILVVLGKVGPFQFNGLGARCETLYRVQEVTVSVGLLSLRLSLSFQKAKAKVRMKGQREAQRKKKGKTVHA
jgi:peptide subunit release factor RF-3